MRYFTFYVFVCVYTKSSKLVCIYTKGNINLD